MFESRIKIFEAVIILNKVPRWRGIGLIPISQLSQFFNLKSKLTREVFFMRENPNHSIRCTVRNCAHHCGEAQYCALDSIQVGTHEENPTQIECTDCESFRMK